MAAIYKMANSTDVSEPSYVIVNKQLQDVIRLQHTAVARLKAKVRETESFFRCRGKTIVCHVKNMRS